MYPSEDEQAARNRLRRRRLSVRPRRRVGKAGDWRHEDTRADGNDDGPSCEKDMIAYADSSLALEQAVSAHDGHIPLVGQGSWDESSRAWTMLSRRRRTDSMSSASAAASFA